MLPGMSIEEIEAAISQLSPDDLAQLAAWFMEFQAGARGQQVDADVKGGKLDQVARQAKEDSPPGAPGQQVDADVKGGKLDQLARQPKEDSPPKRAR